MSQGSIETPRKGISFVSTYLNLSDQLLHELGKQIVQGKLLPGEFLPKVEVLSEQRGVSRTVVREALKGLTARRLVESTTKVGTVVRPRSDWQWWDPNVLVWASHAKDNQSFLLQLTEVRLAIELAAVELAVANATDSDIAEIETAYYKLEASISDEQEWAKADYEFHNSILLASHNVLMISLVSMLRTTLINSRHVTIPRLKNQRKNTSEENFYDEILLHKEVMEAIRVRDKARASQAMHKLMKRVAQLIRD